MGITGYTLQFLVAVQSLSPVQPCVMTWTVANQAPLSSTVSRGLLRLTFIPSVMLSNHLFLCLFLLLLPSLFPSVRVHSSESDLHIRWPNYWSFSSTSVLPMNIQDLFPVGLTGLIMQSRGLSRVFSDTTIGKHQFFATQLSLWSNFQICT